MSRLAAVLTDVRPLRESAAYRRLWIGQAISGFGQQMSVVAVAYEVYRITGSSFAVGLVGLAGLLPLVLGGLYGGALVDAFDRRRVALVSALGLWACSMALVVHSALQRPLGRRPLHDRRGAVGDVRGQQPGPARRCCRSCCRPRCCPPRTRSAWRPPTCRSRSVRCSGGVLIAWRGPEAAYVADAILFVAALYSVARLPALPPSVRQPVPGLRSVVEGLRFLRQAPNVRMTFVIDLCAMVLAQPRALFPALALTVFATGPSTLGLLQSAPGIGAVIAFAVSGWISRVHRHGLAVAVAVVAYGAASRSGGCRRSADTHLGGTALLWLCVAFLAGSGAADMVSAAYRSTILQTAAPDEMRGRMQGVFIVVVAGGPPSGRLRDRLARRADGGAVGHDPRRPCSASAACSRPSRRSAGSSRTTRGTPSPRTQPEDPALGELADVDLEPHLLGATQQLAVGRVQRGRGEELASGPLAQQPAREERLARGRTTQHLGRHPAQ
ncbi:MAG: MFS transporter, partial [Aeromicrobium erythreum]